VGLVGPEDLSRTCCVWQTPPTNLAGTDIEWGLTIMYFKLTSCADMMLWVVSLLQVVGISTGNTNKKSGYWH